MPGSCPKELHCFTALHWVYISQPFFFSFGRNSLPWLATERSPQTLQNLGQSREPQSCYLFQAVIEQEKYRGMRTILNGI